MSILSLNYSILFLIQSVNERFAFRTRLKQIQLRICRNTTE